MRKGDISIIAGLGSVLLWVGLSLAQAPVVVNLATARLGWDWSQGTGGSATEFRVKCGTQSGTYPLITAVARPTQELAVNQVITTAGIYFCVVTAANTTPTPVLESGPSNELAIDVRQFPAAPGNLRVTAP